MTQDLLEGVADRQVHESIAFDEIFQGFTSQNFYHLLPALSLVKVKVKNQFVLLLGPHQRC